nr:hypothetical protein [Tanacetum cinerariifolium]
MYSNNDLRVYHRSYESKDVVTLLSKAGMKPPDK